MILRIEQNIPHNYLEPKIERNLTLLSAGENAGDEIIQGVAEINSANMASEAMFRKASSLLGRNYGSPKDILELKKQLRQMALATSLQIGFARALHLESGITDAQFWLDNTNEDRVRFEGTGGLIIRPNLPRFAEEELVKRESRVKLLPNEITINVARRRAQSALEQASRDFLGVDYNRLTQSANRMVVGNFADLERHYVVLGIAGHDLRNPLTAAFGLSQVLFAKTSGKDRDWIQPTTIKMEQALDKLTRRLSLFNAQTVELKINAAVYSGQEFLESFKKGVDVFLGSMGLSLDTITQHIDPSIDNFQVVVPEDFGEKFGEDTGTNLLKKAAGYQGSGGEQKFAVDAKIIVMNGQYYFCLTTLDNMGGLLDEIAREGRFNGHSGWENQKKLKEQGIQTSGQGYRGLTQEIQKFSGDIITNECILLPNGEVVIDPEVVNSHPKQKRSVQIHLFIPAKKRF